MVATVAHTNGVTETIAHDPNRLARPGSISAAGPFASWTTGAYTWDGVGNVKTMGGSWFLYDKVSRLKEAHVKTGPSGTGSEVWQAYSYDGFGNLTGYVGTVGRNLPTDLATNKLNAAAFDDRGNMTAWNGHVYTWTGTDQLERHQIAASSQDWYHLYTVDDERLVSVDWVTGAKYLRFRDLDGKILREVKQTFVGGNEIWSVERDYMYRGNQLLAAETPQGRRHFHPDHLGTPRLITNATGQQVAFHTYYPFGEEATPWNQDTERLKFTGHERDFLSPAGAGDDLDAMRARYCSPITGRFLGVDPASASASAKRPQSWNRYSYSLNNPTNVVDPDGQVPVPLVIGLAVVGGILFGPDAANTPTSPDDPGVNSSQGMNAVAATIGSVGVIALVKQFFTGGSQRAEFAQARDSRKREPTSPKPEGGQSPTIRPDIVLSGGRSGEKTKDLTGPANSAVRGGGERVFVTNDKGQVILDVTGSRVKVVTPGQGAGAKRPPTAQELELLKAVLGGG
jgi:RHS repeat-associated protein